MNSDYETYDIETLSIEDDVKRNHRKKKVVPTPMPDGTPNIHMYDGQLYQPEIRKRTREEKERLFSMFRNTPKYQPIHPLLNLIMNENGMESNHMLSDNLFACDILAELISYILSNKNIDKDKDIVDTINLLLNEQCNDMYSGDCGAGRMRLLQILMAIKGV
jgi:hypothetical protein